MAKYSNKFGKHRRVGARQITPESLVEELEFGLLPIGSVIQLTSDLTGSYTHPGGGAIDNGLMLCDGVSVIPQGPMAGQTPPGLNNDCFLKGAAAAGVSGGSDTKVIPAAALPVHGHGMTINAVNAPHDHVASPNGTANALHGHTTYTAYYNFNAPNTSVIDRNDTNPGQNFFQANIPAVNAPHNTPAGNVPATNNPHGHPTIVGSTGDGSPVNTLDVLPDYISTVYAIRVI